MATSEERLQTLETESKLACHERAEMSKAITQLCGEIDKDRQSRNQYQEKLSELLHGKDTENPGLIIEVDRLKNWRRRFGNHVNWLWGVLASAVASAVAWFLSQIGGKQ